MKTQLEILELFGGIGACTVALQRLGVDIHIADYVEIDKYAVKSYNAMHDTNFEPQDIREWDKDIKVDLIMHGSPCQDFSVAGLGAGGDKDSGTRSSLMYETIRIVEKLKPKYVIWENVKNLLSKKHVHNFEAYLEIMEQLGYKNYYQVLNAKDYGIPQNRERVFTVSVRKDIDTGFTFPPKQELNLSLKDMLEDNVDEKYYLSESNLKTYNRDFGSKGKQVNLSSIVPTLTASMGTGGGNVPIIDLKSKCKRLKKLVANTTFETGKVLNMDLYNQTTNENISQCLTEPHHNSQRLFDGYRIRKLTPKECWRLMGFSDSDFEKAQKVNSNTQLYKQAGNSIVVDVLEAILRNLLTNKEEN